MKLISKFSLVVFGLSLACTSCSFVLPTQREAGELTRRKVFTSGVPAWVSTRAGMGGGSSQSFLAGGVVPISYDLPRGAVGQDLEYFEEEYEEKQTLLAKKTEVSQISKDESSIEEVVATCPGVEKSLVDAITTVNVNKRISKYRRLLTRCPSSSRLWSLLGQDLDRIGKHNQARLAFQRAETLGFRDKGAAASTQIKGRIKSKR